MPSHRWENFRTTNGYMDYLLLPEMNLHQNPQQFEVLGLYVVVIFLFLIYIYIYIPFYIFLKLNIAAMKQRGLEDEFPFWGFVGRCELFLL